MLRLENETDLQRLVSDQIRESLTLDYKASAALGRSDKQRDELCKDVTAFANSAGGQLVIGVEENKHVPSRVDEGAEPTITKEWVEQVIDSRIQPRIEGLTITPIQLAKGLGFVITVPQAKSRAPHQAADKKYYKRQNFQCVPMEDYEIRDTLRRATTPELFVALSLGDQPKFVEYAPNTEISNPITLRVLVGNRSPQPAYHTNVLLGIDDGLVISSSSGAFLPAPAVPPDHPGTGRNWVAKRLTSPPEQPIFQEADPNLSAMGLTFGIKSEHLQSSLFRITTIVQTPGFSATEQWVLICQRGYLTLCDPSHPRSRTA
jgi:Putative DNA-binding domain